MVEELGPILFHEQFAEDGVIEAISESLLADEVGCAVLGDVFDNASGLDDGGGIDVSDLDDKPVAAQRAAGQAVVMAIDPEDFEAVVVKCHCGFG